MKIAPPRNEDLVAPLVIGESFLAAGENPEGAIAPPKTYENNFIHHEFLQFQKQYSPMAILSSIILSQQCCEVYSELGSSELLK